MFNFVYIPKQSALSELSAISRRLYAAAQRAYDRNQQDRMLTILRFHHTVTTEIHLCAQTANEIAYRNWLGAFERWCLPQGERLEQQILDLLN